MVESGGGEVQPLSPGGIVLASSGLDREPHSLLEQLAHFISLKIKLLNERGNERVSARQPGSNGCRPTRPPVGHIFSFAPR